MKKNYEIRIAKEEEHTEINDLLNESNLCPVESKELLANFMVMTADQKIIGVIGLEIFEGDALLRSFAVVKEFRQKGFGSKLYTKIMEIVPVKGINQLFLLTETARTYFELRGFEIVDRNSAPKKILNSTEFKTFCPESAVCMRKIV
ncbi:arsenic resistance N-acetyltransferase ArsN2 [Bacteroidota bacterium]